MKAMKATRQPRPKFSEDNLCWAAAPVEGRKDAKGSEGSQEQ